MGGNIDSTKDNATYERGNKMNAIECKKMDNLLNEGTWFKYVGYDYELTKRNTNGGLVRLIKMKHNGVAGLGVELTRMTAKDGTIVYAVIVRHNGRRRGNRWTRGYKQVYKYTTLGKAYETFKMATA